MVDNTVLGVGGFGTVLWADDLYVRVGKDRQPQKVAIKAIHDSRWETILERDLAETFDEANTLSTLNHPGIIKTLNRGFGDPARPKRPYVVMEYFPGVTLEALLKDKKALPVRDVVVIAKQIAEAIHQAHALGIYHRDVKPANIMVAFDDAREKRLFKMYYILNRRNPVAEFARIRGGDAFQTRILANSATGTPQYCWAGYACLRRWPTNFHSAAAGDVAGNLT